MKDTGIAGLGIAEGTLQVNIPHLGTPLQTVRSTPLATVLPEQYGAVTPAANAF